MRYIYDSILFFMIEFIQMTDISGLEMAAIIIVGLVYFFSICMCCGDYIDHRCNEYQEMQ